MSLKLRTFVPALAAFAVACADSPSSPGVRDGLVSEPAVALLDAPSNEELARVAPSFGGFYYSEDQTPTVWLGDAADRGAVEGAMRGYLRSRGLTEGALRVQPAAFSYRELDKWFDTAAGAFDLPGVNMVDLDEARNRVMIGVDHPGAVGLVRATMARQGIPEDALIVEVREAIRPMVSLRDLVRPIGGGLQINFPGYLCTLGFNATDGGENSFITNSHCTTTQGGVESTPYYQPLQSSSPTRIALEVEDPVYLKTNCPANIRGKKCRNSDASRARYDAGISFTLGLIKKTTGANNGSLDIAGDFSIGGEAVATVGQQVSKIGRTTGWSRGSVTATCAHTGVQGSSIVQLCQTHVQANVGSGDSGSPAFMETGANSANLVGILWGGGTNVFVYSPMSGIRADIGNIVVR